MPPELQPLPSQTSAPLIEGPAPLPDVEPLRLQQDESLRARQEAAERARKEAWEAVYRWNGNVLHAYSLGREECWRRMCEGDVDVEEYFGLERLEAASAIKLLYVCTTAAEDLVHAETAELIEQAEAWADAQVTRQQTAAAITLARKILNDSRAPQARLKPPERRAKAGNAASPVWPGSYLVMVAAALQGSMTAWDMEWNLSLARGRTLSHGRWIYDGAPTLWPEAELSLTGAWLAKWQSRINEQRARATRH